MWLPLIAYIAWSIPLSIIDLKFHRLPNIYVVGLTLSIFITTTFSMGLEVLISSVRFGFIYFAIFLLLSMVSKGSIGLGDVKYSFACGTLIGIYTSELWLIVLWTMFALAGLVSIGLLALARLRRSDRIAFGPYMAITTVAFVGNSLG